MLDSPTLAQKMEEAASHGYPSVCFVIGSSYGLAPVLKERAGLRLSLSRMTFPHQLMRVILLEQVYRAFKINAHEPYHK